MKDVEKDLNEMMTTMMTVAKTMKTMKTNRIEYNFPQPQYFNMKMWIASKAQHIQKIFMRMSARPHGPRAWELETVSS